MYPTHPKMADTRIPARFLVAVITVWALAPFMSASAAGKKVADVVVYSGTPGGIAASIHAAREGTKVILVEPTKHVGGLSTSGINTAETEHMLKWTIGGFANEYYHRMGKYYKETKAQQTYPHKNPRLDTIYFFESSVAEKTYLAMLKEAGVEVIYGASVDKVAKDGPWITSITLTDSTQFSARVFVDASYEGDLMARAGVSYAVGREAQAEFNEDAAGVRFDPNTHKARTVDEKGNLLPGISAWAKDLTQRSAHRAPMNYNFRLTVASDPDLQVPFPTPKKYDPKRYALLANWLHKQTSEGKRVERRDIIDLYERRNGKFEMNNKQAAVLSLGHFGGQFDWPDASYEERERIYQDHLDYTLGLLHFLMNDDSVPENLRNEIKGMGLHKGEFADNGHLPYQLYVREARRMKGETIVRQQDVQKDRRKPDSIGMSSHFIDCHHVQRVALNENEFVNEGRIWRTGYAYQIPYRAILPKAAECTNLLVPVAASYTHVAFCTLRLESVWMITGHGAGVAAAMAVKDGIGVHKVDVSTLQDKLREQGQVVDFIPSQPEKYPNDGPLPQF